MKKIKLFAILATVALALVSCSSKPVKTIENLKSAATGEANASEKYAKFAQKAEADSMFNIAAMFRATSEAEAVHKANHLKVLKELGVDFSPIIEAINVATTLENLQSAMKGEDYEVSNMYPEFIKIAEQEKAKKALNSFDFAIKVEAEHFKYYNEAINLITSEGNDLNVNKAWEVCPVCGDTFKKGAVKKCNICGTDAAKFKTF
ncbi:MAG: Rubrerythrin [Bacteroidetes bacterium]|nr:Rubrerythrin [Bacteroidota bacterium]